MRIMLSFPEQRTEGAAPAVLTADAVWFAYGPEPVLEDVSLRVCAGEFAALVG